MKEKILNNFVRIEPLEYEGFVKSSSQKYEMVGKVIGVAEGIEIPIGAQVLFDSFIARKFPVVGKENVHEWYVPYDEIIKFEVDE